VTLDETLVAMGNTENEVVAFLRARHITGSRKDSEKCPVAEYLSHETGEDIGVAEKFIYTLFSKVPTALPQSVQDFIAGFDAGKYPDLER